MDAGTDDPVDRLERHLVEEFIASYIGKAMGRRTAVKIDPAKLFMAMRFAGIKASRQTLDKLLTEMVSK